MIVDGKALADGWTIGETGPDDRRTATREPLLVHRDCVLRKVLPFVNTPQLEGPSPSIYPMRDLQIREYAGDRAPPPLTCYEPPLARLMDQGVPVD